MLDRLLEPKHCGHNLYANDLAPCQIVSVGIEGGPFIIMMNLLLSAVFYLACCWPFSISLILVMYKIVKEIHHICIYTSVYLPVKVNTQISLKSSIFYGVENSTPLVGIEPTISPWIIMSQIIKSMNLKYISAYQRLQTKKLYTKITKIWLAYVRWRPFWILRFVGKRCHLQFGIRQKWVQHKNSYRNNKWSTFPQECLKVFI